MLVTANNARIHVVSITAINKARIVSARIMEMAKQVLKVQVMAGIKEEVFERKTITYVE